MNWFFFRLVGIILWQLNKKDIALLLSTYLIEHSPAEDIVVVADGFVEATIVKWSDPTLGLSRIEGDHEGADTYLTLHCIHALMKSMVVSVRDTGVLVLYRRTMPK